MPIVPPTASRRPLKLILLGLLFSHAAAADDAFIIGVGTHLMNRGSWPERALELLEAAGVNSVRDDAYWSVAEPRRGKLRIHHNWRAYLETAQEHRLRPLLVLGYGNPLYDNYAKPRQPALRDAFGNYVGFISKELAGQANFYEVWNEWDRENPVDDDFMRDYARLVEDTSSRLRASGQPVTILAGAVTSTGLDVGFAERLLATGVLEKVDGLSLHPFVHCRFEERHTPEHWIAWLRRLDGDLQRVSGRPVPLYLTEIGWPSNEGRCGVDERTQAAYLARSLFLAQTLPDIKGVWWKSLTNDGDSRLDPEQNFGLFNQDLSPKPAYLTLKAISPTLRGFRYDAEKSRENESLFLLRFNRGAEQVLVAWSTGLTRRVQVDASSVQSGNVQWIDSGAPENGRSDSGIPWDCNDGRCSAQVSVDAFPKIISLGSKPPLFAQ